MKKRKSYAEIGKQAKNRIIAIRVTPNQGKQIEDKAYSKGMNITEYILKQLKLK
jgi:hypothetical protein|tara:strand:+ start:354 stop:515 length:162 start_codon:yes stop_codon:yes gene_type:complete